MAISKNMQWHSVRFQFKNESIAEEVYATYNMRIHMLCNWAVEFSHKGNSIYLKSMNLHEFERASCWLKSCLI